MDNEVEKLGHNLYNKKVTYRVKFKGISVHSISEYIISKHDSIPYFL